MEGIADLGGTTGWGPVRPPRRDEPVFPERWNARAFALTLLAIRISGRNVDAFRHAQERLDRYAYLDDGYFGRWLNAAELMLTDSAILAPGAVTARARVLRGEQIPEPPAPKPRKPDYKPTAEGSLRTVDAPAAFAVGERVRAKNVSPAGHTRLAGYVRGHAGVVAAVQPAALLPDTHAHFLGENPQYVYTVCFDSRELWPSGSGTDSRPFKITVELYESYLEQDS